MLPTQILIVWCGKPRWKLSEELTLIHKQPKLKEWPILCMPDFLWFHKSSGLSVSLSLFLPSLSPPALTCTNFPFLAAVYLSLSSYFQYLSLFIFLNLSLCFSVSHTLHSHSNWLNIPSFSPPFVSLSLSQPHFLSLSSLVELQHAVFEITFILHQYE